MSLFLDDSTSYSDFLADTLNVSSSATHQSTLSPSDFSRLRFSGASTSSVQPISGAIRRHIQKSSSAQPEPQPRSERKYLRRRECLVMELDAWWEIESGYVRSITWDEDGNVTTLGIWGPGEQLSFGLSSVQPLHFECLTSTRLRCNRDEQEQQCSDTLHHWGRCTEELLFLLQIRCTKQRLHRILQWLAQRFGSTNPGGYRLMLRLTHQELAELIGSTRVTVTRLMQQLKQEGTVQLLGRSLVIKP